MFGVHLEQVPQNNIFKMLGYVTKLIAYGFICIVGVIGNSFLLFAICKVTLTQVKMMKKILTNLVIIDLLINVIDVPFKIFKVIHPDLKDHPYLLALVRCRVMPFIANSLYGALINTLVALTIGRYVAVVHPFRNITRRQYRITVALIWVLATVFSIPEILIKHLNNDDMECELTFPSIYLKYVYYVFDASKNCIVPLCIVIYCYVVIWRVLKNHQIPGERIGNERILETREVNRMKSMKMIFAITMYFIISVLPWYIAFLTYELARHERNQMRNHTIHFWLDWLALTHLFINPLLCCLTNSSIRNSIKNSIKCGSRAADNHSTSTTSAAMP